MHSRVALALSALLAAGAATAQEMDEKTALICAEAEERYQELFGHPSAEADGVVVVTMFKYTFCPPALTVAPGTTVRWVNVDKRTSHSVWFNAAGLPESERMFPEEDVEMTFLEPLTGENTYLCGPHWDTHGMIGRITVAP